MRTSERADAGFLRPTDACHLLRLIERLRHRDVGYVEMGFHELRMEMAGQGLISRIGVVEVSSISDTLLACETTNVVAVGCYFGG